MLNGSQTYTQSEQEQSAEASNAQPATPPAFVCVSTALRRLLLQAEVAGGRLQFATLEGEPGTGKHLFAQNLHRNSALGLMPFRRCDAREWLATETDAIALSGTLYLDRVDLLAITGQGLLLNLVKALQDNPVTKFLLLVSTQSSLRMLASQGQFLPDLAFRLSAVRFPLPPLREHREDIAPIAQSLIDRICRRYQQPTAVLAPGTLPRLLQHGWPGNVRELASILESAILDSTTGILRPTDLILQQPSVPQAAAALPVQPLPVAELNLDFVIQRHIQVVLELNRGNKLRAAKQLGISRSTLYRLLEPSTGDASSERDPD